MMFSVPSKSTSTRDLLFFFALSFPLFETDAMLMGDAMRCGWEEEEIRLNGTGPSCQGSRLDKVKLLSLE